LFLNTLFVIKKFFSFRRLGLIKLQKSQ